MLEYPAAERSVLGACLSYPEACAQACTELTVQDFSFEIHQIVFATIHSLFSNGTHVDFVTVSSALEQSNDLTTVGGYDYLLQIAKDGAISRSVAEHIKVVRQASTHRKLQSFCTDLIRGLDTTLEVREALGLMSQKVVELSEKEQGYSKAAPEMASDFLDYISSPDNPGMKTGFTQLDEMTGGFRGGELIVLAGRPAMGKTGMALALAVNLAKSGKKVQVFEAEMSSNDIATRCISSLSRLPLVQLRSKKIADTDMNRLVKFTAEFTDLPLEVVDSAGWTVTAIRAAAMKKASTTGLDVIVIDYLQLLQTEKKGGNTNDAVADQTRRLKILARELSVPIILLSQLNRGVEGRTDKHPALSDLRDSGAIEQDADAVLLLYRGNYYDEEIPANIGEMILAKNRNGPTGTIGLNWIPAFATYSNP